MQSADNPPGIWKKSSYSAHNGNCIEVAGHASDTVRVRDSKNPAGAILDFTVTGWGAFLGGVRNGDFGRKPGNL